MGKRNKSQPNKKRPSAKLSPFAQACEEANFLLEMAFSEGSSSLETVHISRRKKRLDDIRAELDAARARVEAHFAQATMRPDAIRQRIDLSSQQNIEQPFNVMAGKRR